MTEFYMVKAVSRRLGVIHSFWLGADKRFLKPNAPQESAAHFRSEAEANAAMPTFPNNQDFLFYLHRYRTLDPDKVPKIFPLTELVSCGRLLF